MFVVRKTIIAGMVGITFIAGLIYYLVGNKNKEKSVLSEIDSQETKTLTKQVGENVFDFEYEEQELRVIWIEVENLSDLTLIPNFEEKLDSEEVSEKYGCKRLVNAGFYNEEGMPIGLFVSKGETVNQASENVTFNGYFSLSNQNKVSINMVRPNESIKIGLQSGPILAQNSMYRSLNIKKDKPARRVIVSLNEQDNIIFLTIFDRNSIFQGPYLFDLPQILEVISSKLGIEIIDALNLDGGAASVLYSDGVSLQELTNVGGFFCIK